ncbi:MAG: beta-ketoacyl-ACP synthase III [Kiritimatiellia bacterium]
MQRVKIAGTGSYLPARIVTNDEIARRLDTSDEWIFTHSGIHARHWAAPEETSSTMGAEAARRALAAANVPPEEIGLIVCATSSPDYGTYPANACLIQAALGCVNAGCFDVSAACSGFLYALETARDWMLAHPGMKALAIGCEVLTRSVDWNDRSISILFGDGAGAVVLAMADCPADVGEYLSVHGADGTGSQAITHDGGYRKPMPEVPVGEVAMWPVTYMTMNGRAVFNFAVRKLSEIVDTLTARAGIAPDDLTRIYAHQANARILEAVAKRVDLPLEKFFMSIAETGNMSTASVPYIIDKAVCAGELKEGDRVLLSAFGSGLTWGGALTVWPWL